MQNAFSNLSYLCEVYSQSLIGLGVAHQLVHLPQYTLINKIRFEKRSTLDSFRFLGTLWVRRTPWHQPHLADTQKAARPPIGSLD